MLRVSLRDLPDDVRGDALAHDQRAHLAALRLLGQEVAQLLDFLSFEP
jgi:hypothetical protein